MLIRINKVVRHRKRLLTLTAALLATLALVSTHSAMAGGHHEHSAHHGVATDTVVLLCMAVIETGVAVTFAAAAFAFARHESEPPPPRLFSRAAAQPARFAHGPPAERQPIFQVFLR